MLHLVVSRVHHPQPRTTAACPHYPAALMAGVNHNKENISILAGYWNVGVSLRLRVASQLLAPAILI